MAEVQIRIEQRAALAVCRVVVVRSPIRIPIHLGVSQSIRRCVPAVTVESAAPKEVVVSVNDPGVVIAVDIAGRATTEIAVLDVVIESSGRVIHTHAIGRRP
jgi:hypothetical protein